MPLHVGQPHNFVRSHHLISDQNIPNAGCGHDFRFAQFRTGHTDGARTQIHVRNRGNLNALRVGTPVDACVTEVRSHRVDVPFQRVQIYPKNRCIQLTFA